MHTLAARRPGPVLPEIPLKIEFRLVLDTTKPDPISPEALRKVLPDKRLCRPVELPSGSYGVKYLMLTQAPARSPRPSRRGPGAAASAWRAAS